MLTYLKKRWKYLVAKLGGKFDENADPKVQLQQAIKDAQDQHRRLREQAANVIANQKQTEMRLNRSLADLERVNANARQAVLMAEDAHKAGDAEKTASYTSAAEQFANRLITLESDIEGLKSMHFQATQAADQAKAAVKQNSELLQKKLSEQKELLSQLDQAKMQETVNSAMATLSESVGEDVPTFNEVREKIEARYAKARAVSELTEGNVDSRMQEIEVAARNVEATARLDEIKTQLGIASGPIADSPQIEGGSDTAETD